ncbi:B3 domain-containing protein [Hordeum vulgare]|nr:B3 domain-containing protein [Hordeum vulgare]
MMTFPLWEEPTTMDAKGPESEGNNANSFLTRNYCRLDPPAGMEKHDFDIAGVGDEMEFFTIILEKSSSRQVLPYNFMKMLDGHRPQNIKLRQAGNGLRKLWDVEMVFNTDGSMYLDRGWKQFVRAYDLRHGYFFVFRYDGNATFAMKEGAAGNFVKMLDDHRPQNMKLRQAGNGLRKLWDVEVVFDTDGNMYLDRGWKQFVRAYDLRHGYFLVFRYDDNATFAVKVFNTTMCRRRYQDDDDAKEYIPQPVLGLRRSKRIRMMKEKTKKQE